MFHFDFHLLHFQQLFLLFASGSLIVLSLIAMLIEQLYGG